MRETATSASQLDVREPWCGLLQFLLNLRHSLARFHCRGAGYSPQQSFQVGLLALGFSGFEHRADGCNEWLDFN